MRRLLLLGGVGLLALMLQGALASALPAHWVPGLGFLLVVAAGPRLRSPLLGVLLAAGVGLATDLLSGALLGQHVLLRMAAFGAARFWGRRLNLYGLLPTVLFVSVLSVVDALALWALSAFFAPGEAPPLPGAGALLARALVQGACAHPVALGVERLLGRLGGPEPSGLLRLQTRGYST